VQINAAASSETALHGVGVFSLHADDLDFGSDHFYIGGNACNQATAPDRDKNRVERPGMLAQNLHAHGATTGNDVGIIERVHESQVLAGLEFLSLECSIGITVAKKHHIGAPRSHRLDFDLWGGNGHDDDGATTQTLGGQSHP